MILDALTSENRHVLLYIAFVGSMVKSEPEAPVDAHKIWGHKETSAWEAEVSTNISHAHN